MLFFVAALDSAFLAAFDFAFLAALGFAFLKEARHHVWVPRAGMMYMFRENIFEYILENILLESIRTRRAAHLSRPVAASP